MTRAVDRLAACTVPKQLTISSTAPIQTAPRHDRRVARDARTIIPAPRSDTDHHGREDIVTIGQAHTFAEDASLALHPLQKLTNTATEYPLPCFAILQY